MEALTITDESTKAIKEINSPTEERSVRKLKYGPQVVWPQEDDYHGEFWLNADQLCELEVGADFYSKYENEEEWSYGIQRDLIHFGGDLGPIYIRHDSSMAPVLFSETDATTPYRVGGRIGALAQETGTGSGAYFHGMFMDSVHLIDAEELRFPSGEAVNASSMFLRCVNLKRAPKIIASMELFDSCYMQMFDGCTSLENVPELPATHIPRYAYGLMFRQCESITQVQSLPIQSIDIRGCRQMFARCYSLERVGDFDNVTVGEGGMDGMFENCVALKEMPSLKKAYAADIDAFRDMFMYCRSLERADKLGTTPKTRGSYYKMFFGCDNLKYVKMGPGNLGYDVMWHTFAYCSIEEFHWQATMVDDWPTYEGWHWGCYDNAPEKTSIIMNWGTPKHIDVYMPSDLQLFKNPDPDWTNKRYFTRFLFSVDTDTLDVTWHWV